MLRLLIVFGIIALVALVLITFIFRHEIETLAHKYGLRDDLKHLQHQLKRKENELATLEKKKADVFEKRSVEVEIFEIKNLIKEMETNKYE